jgi:hypothetical protein
MRHWPIVMALGAAMLLSGCGALNPYETLPLSPHPGASDTRPRVGVCFDGLVSTPAEVAVAAQQECGPAAVPRRVATDYGLLTCPVLLPGRATFVCTPKK